MQIGWILRKFIQPDIRPDIRIVTKINRDLFWHRNMNSWKYHVVSYYRFWVIVWTNIREKNIRISGRISGRMIESDLNFHQYFKTILSIYPENFMQIGWILRKFIPNRISGRISGWINFLNIQPICMKLSRYGHIVVLKYLWKFEGWSNYPTGYRAGYAVWDKLQ